MKNDALGLTGVFTKKFSSVFFIKAVEREVGITKMWCVEYESMICLEVKKQ